MRHAQGVCLFCGARWLFIAQEARTPGDAIRTECNDCGWITRQVVAVVWDPDLYELVDSYGPGVQIQRRCVDCGERSYGPGESCPFCSSPRQHFTVSRSEEAAV